MMDSMIRIKNIFSLLNGQTFLNLNKELFKSNFKNVLIQQNVVKQNVFLVYYSDYAYVGISFYNSS